MKAPDTSPEEALARLAGTAPGSTGYPLSLQCISNYIDGEMVEPHTDAHLDNFEPATGHVYSRIPDSDEQDVARAVAAAQKAFGKWSGTSAEERSGFMLRIADLIEQNADRLALAESIDNGKPITLARAVDIPRAAANFRFFATAILHARSDAHFTEGRAINITMRQPLGVAGCISPWNLPLYLFTWKIAPALATGNTVVAKPSEVTPMTAFLLSELCQEAELPAGVLNIVHGLGIKVGAAIVRHPDIPVISFTGGTATGTEIARTASPMFKKLGLELGGKNANVIFADCDVDRALSVSLQSSFANQGQICLCGSRMYVERPIFDEFLAAFIDRAGRLLCGDPLDERTEQGALVSKQHLEKVASHIRIAREEGGRVRCGGGPPPGLPERCRGGYFLQPTVITSLPPDCRTNQEEIFGPVVTIAPFDDEDEVVGYANGTKYGLSASVWTSDLDRAHRVAAQLDVGTVWVNCWLVRDLRVPFGGMKQSGVGREGGDEALRFFTETKNVCIRTD